MKAAITSGLYNVPLQEPIFCSIGDCHWDQWTILGICSECRNLNDTVRSNCSRTGGGMDACQYEFVQTNLMSTFGYECPESSCTLWNSSAKWLDSLFTFQKQPQIAVFNSIKFPNIGNSSITLPDANQCLFRLCAKTYYNSTYTNGTVDLGRSEVTELVWGQIPNSPSLGPLYTASNHSISNVSFAIHPENIDSLSTFLYGIFTTSLMFDGSSGRNEHGSSSGALPDTPDFGREFQQYTNLSASMASLADSMTIAMRGGANSTTVPGVALIPQTFIEVQWGWLALPLTLVVMSLVLLVIVTIKDADTQRRGMEKFKLGVALSRDRGLEGNRAEGYCGQSISRRYREKVQSETGR